MKLEGSCHCGEITFVAEGSRDNVQICHCTDCQKLSGSPFRATVSVRESETTVVGTPAIYIKTADSGTKRLNAFCGTCGSPIYSTAPTGDDREFRLRLGLIEQRALLVPKTQGWRRSMLPWLKNMIFDASPD